MQAVLYEILIFIVCLVLCIFLLKPWNLARFIISQ